MASRRDVGCPCWAGCGGAPATGAGEVEIEAGGPPRLGRGGLGQGSQEGTACVPARPGRTSGENPSKPGVHRAWPHPPKWSWRVGKCAGRRVAACYRKGGPRRHASNMAHVCGLKLTGVRAATALGAAGSACGPGGPVHKARSAPPPPADGGAPPAQLSGRWQRPPPPLVLPPPPDPPTPAPFAACAAAAGVRGSVQRRPPSSLPPLPRSPAESLSLPSLGGVTLGWYAACRQHASPAPGPRSREGVAAATRCRPAHARPRRCYCRCRCKSPPALHLIEWIQRSVLHCISAFSTLRRLPENFYV